MNQPSCFNCDHVGGSMYRSHDGKTNWFMGLTADGQAHYACTNCHPYLYNAMPVKPNGDYDHERDQEQA